MIDPLGSCGATLATSAPRRLPLPATLGLCFGGTYRRRLADDRENRARHFVAQRNELVAAGLVLQPGEIRTSLWQRVLAPEPSVHGLHLRRMRVLEDERLGLGLLWSRRSVAVVRRVAIASPAALALSAPGVAERPHRLVGRLERNRRPVVLGVQLGEKVIADAQLAQRPFVSWTLRAACHGPAALWRNRARPPT